MTTDKVYTDDEYKTLKANEHVSNEQLETDIKYTELELEVLNLEHTAFLARARFERSAPEGRMIIAKEMQLLVNKTRKSIEQGSEFLELLKKLHELRTRGLRNT